MDDFAIGVGPWNAPRDPDRIPQVLEAIEHEWRKDPDIRLGQMLVNLVRIHTDTATEEEGNTEHGNDERIRVEEVRRGPRVLFDVVVKVAGTNN